jgi:hypothetical protein
MVFLVWYFEPQWMSPVYNLYNCGDIEKEKYKGVCMVKCGAGTFRDVASGVCVGKCPNNFVWQDDKCSLKCQDGFEVAVDGTQCLTLCATGEKRNNRTNECEKKSGFFDQKYNDLITGETDDGQSSLWRTRNVLIFIGTMLIILFLNWSRVTKEFSRRFPDASDKMDSITKRVLLSLRGDGAVVSLNPNIQNNVTYTTEAEEEIKKMIEIYKKALSPSPGKEVPRSIDDKVQNVINNIMTEPVKRGYEKAMKIYHKANLPVSVFPDPISSMGKGAYWDINIFEELRKKYKQEEVENAPIAELVVKQPSSDDKHMIERAIEEVRRKRKGGDWPEEAKKDLTKELDTYRTSLYTLKFIQEGFWNDDNFEFLKERYLKARKEMDEIDTRSKENRLIKNMTEDESKIIADAESLLHNEKWPELDVPGDTSEWHKKNYKYGPFLEQFKGML